MPTTLRKLTVDNVARLYDIDLDEVAGPSPATRERDRGRCVTWTSTTSASGSPRRAGSWPATAARAVWRAT